jgi:hypothetical protein
MIPMAVDSPLKVLSIAGKYFVYRGSVKEVFSCINSQAAESSTG